MKALVLASVAGNLRSRLLDDFRGRRGHDIEWLGTLYRQNVGAAVPRAVTRHLARVASWSTDMRYVTSLLKRRDADQFMESVVAIAAWAEGRM